MSVYFDNAATTPVYPEILDSMQLLNQELFGNPSSLHSEGRKARKALEKAREDLAQNLNAKAEEIFFCSGATEANNTIFKLLDYDLIITSPAEHASVIEAAKSLAKPIIWLELDREALVDLEFLENSLKQNSGKKILVSVMHGNNEIGSINDIEKITKLTKSFANVFVHSDCVQTFSKYDLDLSKIDIDFISASAHKLHGPKGIGLIYISKKFQENHVLELSPLIVGGGQEKDLRAGTQNVTGAVSFAKAAQLNNQSANRDKVLSLQKYLLEKLSSIDGFVLNGPKEVNKRVLGNLNFALRNCKLKSEELVLQLDLQGFAVSSGSACTSNKISEVASIQSSYVLRAAGISEEIAVKSIRVSLSALNSREEIDIFVSALTRIVEKFALNKAEDVIQ